VTQPVESPWIVAFGLVLLLEGIFPFLFPRQWRDAFRRILELSDGQLRFFGLIALLGGLLLLGLAKFFL
jgi:uncharacterized protein YjeT (DUF2065 family)